MDFLRCTRARFPIGKVLPINLKSVILVLTVQSIIRILDNDQIVKYRIAIHLYCFLDKA